MRKLLLVCCPTSYLNAPTLSGVLPIFDSLECEMIGNIAKHESRASLTTVHLEVHTDADGIRPDSLRSILDTWPATKPKPRVLYTVPVSISIVPQKSGTLISPPQYGSNPTGATATLERRLEVLALSREHDFLIFEGFSALSAQSAYSSHPLKIRRSVLLLVFRLGSTSPILLCARARPAGVRSGIALRLPLENYLVRLARWIHIRT